MKAIIYVMFIAIAGLQSCKEEESYIPDIYWGEANALKNGESWTGLVYAQTDNPEEFVLNIDVYHKKEFRKESFVIFNIPYKVQKNKIDTVRIGAFNSATGGYYDYSISYIENCFTENRFKMVNEVNSENYVTITSYNEDTKEVWGEFQASLIVDNTFRKWPSAPDSIRFMKGKFHTMIKEIKPLTFK